jgi:hypothetical protein
MEPNKVVETTPGVFQWLDLQGNLVTQTKEQIDEEAAKANKTPHLGVYRWTREDGTFR